MITDLTKKRGTLPQLTKTIGKLLPLLVQGLEVLFGKAYQLTRTHIWSIFFTVVIVAAERSEYGG